MSDRIATLSVRKDRLLSLLTASDVGDTDDETRLRDTPTCATLEALTIELREIRNVLKSAERHAQGARYTDANVVDECIRRLDDMYRRASIALLVELDAEHVTRRPKRKGKRS